MQVKPLEDIYYILIMVCIIVVFLIWDYNIVQDNKRLELHEKCMDSYNFLYTTENCKLCDSLIKTK